MIWLWLALAWLLLGVLIAVPVGKLLGGVDRWES